MKKFSIMFVALAAMAGLAVGQAKQAGPAAGSAAAPKPAPPPAGSAAQVAPPMAAPKPPPEIKAALKAMGARARCTGIGMGGADMKTELKMTGTMTNKLAVDGWFIQGSMQATMGTGKTAVKMKMESFMTYDPKLAKWRSVGVMNDGSTNAGTADMKDGKLEGQSDSWGGMMGNMKMRDHGDMTDPKAGMKMWGEASMDGGKTWTKIYEMTCKK